MFIKESLRDLFEDIKTATKDIWFDLKMVARAVYGTVFRKGYLN